MDKTKEPETLEEMRFWWNAKGHSPKIVGVVTRSGFMTLEKFNKLIFRDGSELLSVMAKKKKKGKGGY